ncbi:MAG: hypothetical protein ABI743_02220 [bacterium]
MPGPLHLAMATIGNPLPNSFTWDLPPEVASPPQLSGPSIFFVPLQGGQWTGTARCANAIGSSAPFTFTFNVDSGYTTTFDDISPTGALGHPGELVSMRGPTAGSGTWHWVFDPAGASPADSLEEHPTITLGSPGSYQGSVTTQIGRTLLSFPFEFEVRQPELPVGWVQSFGDKGGIGRGSADAMAAAPSGTMFIGGVARIPDSGGKSESVILSVDAEGRPLWEAAFGGCQHGAVRDIAYDAADDLVFILGDFTETADFDPGPGVVMRESHGNRDAYCVALQAGTGALAWVATWGSPTYDQVHFIHFNLASNRVQLTDLFSGTCDFDPGPGTMERTPALSSDSALLSLDPDTGAFIDVLILDGLGGLQFLAMAPDRTDNLVLAGNFSGQQDFDPGPGTTLREATQSEAYLLGLSAAGGFRWVHTLGQAFALATLAISPTDEIALLGRSSTSAGRTIDLDPGAGIFPITSGGFIAHYGPDGVFRRAVDWGHEAPDRMSTARYDDNGNLLITSTIHFETDFDPGPDLLERRVRGNDDMYLLSLSGASDAFQWVRTIGANAGDCEFDAFCGPDTSPAGLFMAPDGGLLIAGNSDEADFNPGPGVQHRRYDTDGRSFLLHLKADGSW